MIDHSSSITGSPSNISDSYSGKNDVPSEELAAFNAQLAQTLNTHDGERKMSMVSSSPGENMDDEQMEELDAHLENIFRERRKLSN